MSWWSVLHLPLIYNKIQSLLEAITLGQFIFCHCSYMSQCVKGHIDRDSTTMFISLECVFSNVSRQEHVQSLIPILELSGIDLSTELSKIFLKFEDAFTMPNFIRVKTFFFFLKGQELKSQRKIANICKAMWNWCFRIL